MAGKLLNEENLHCEQKEIPSDLNFQKDSKFSWLALGCGFFTQILILGVLHAFGGFFVAFIDEFQTTKGTAAWIGSIAYGLSMFLAPVTGMIIKKFGHRTAMLLGGLFCSVSLLVSSFVTDIRLLFFTFSVVYGTGSCLSITPTMTLGQDYFDKYLSLSVGIMTSGSSIGTLVLAPTTQALIDYIGWRNTFRVYAGTCFLTFLLNLNMRPISNVRKTAAETLKTSPMRRLIEELGLWKNRVFIVWTIGITLVMFGYYIPYVHLVSYAMDKGLTPGQGSILMMVLGASTATGRLMFGKIVQLGLLNRLHMHQLSMIVCGIATMFLPLIASFPGLITFVIMFGLVDGCFVVLLPLMTCSLVQTDKATIAWSFLVCSSSITFTLGPPVAGLMYDALGSYNTPFHVAGIPVITGALILFLIPWAQRTSYVSKEMAAVGEAVIYEPDVDVDFITLSRSSSFVVRNQGSEATMSSYRHGGHRYTESSAYSNRSRTYSTQGVPENEISRTRQHRRREIDQSLTSYERNDEYLFDVMYGASKRTNDNDSRSIATSNRLSSRKSDVINMSLSSTGRSYTRCSIGVQTDDMSDTNSMMFLPSESDICQTDTKQTTSNANSTDRSCRSSMLESSLTSGPIEPAVLEQIERLGETLNSPTRAAELMEDPTPEWIGSSEDLNPSQKSNTSKPSSPKEIVSNPVTFDELLVPAETVSCALSPKHSPVSSLVQRTFAYPDQASLTPTICSIVEQHNNDIFAMDPLSPPVNSSKRSVSPSLLVGNAAQSSTSPLSTNPFNAQPNFLGNQEAFRTIVPPREEVIPIVAKTRVSPKFTECCKTLTGTGSIKEPSPVRDSGPSPPSPEEEELESMAASIVSLSPEGSPDLVSDPIFTLEQTPPQHELRTPTSSIENLINEINK